MASCSFLRVISAVEPRTIIGNGENKAAPPTRHGTHAVRMDVVLQEAPHDTYVPFLFIRVAASAIKLKCQRIAFSNDARSQARSSTWRRCSIRVTT